LVAFADKLNLI